MLPLPGEMGSRELPCKPLDKARRLYPGRDGDRGRPWNQIGGARDGAMEKYKPAPPPTPSPRRPVGLRETWGGQMCLLKMPLEGPGGWMRLGGGERHG